MSRKTITVFKGDGIGPEITDAVLENAREMKILASGLKK